MTADWISAETEEKERHYRGLLGMHIRMCRGILSRQPGPPYLYVDLHAGPGRLEFKGRGFLGSPLIFIDLAAREEIAYESLYFDSDVTVAATLNGHIARMRDEPSGLFDIRPIRQATTVVPKPCEVGMPEWLRDTGKQWDRYGLVYADPIGTEIPVETLAEVSRFMPHVDLLSYVSAANYKRRRGANSARAMLAEHIAAVGKKYVRIREPLGKHQWTFILWTDWKGFPDWRNIGLHKLESERGGQILDQLNLTKPELRKATNTPLWSDDAA